MISNDNIAVMIEHCIAALSTTPALEEIGFGPLKGPYVQESTGVLKGVEIRQVATHIRSGLELSILLSAFDTSGLTGSTFSSVVQLTDRSRGPVMFVNYAMKNAGKPLQWAFNGDSYTDEICSQLQKSIHLQIAFIQEHLTEVVEGHGWIDDARPRW